MSHSRSRRSRSPRGLLGREFEAPDLAAILVRIDAWLYRHRRRMRLALRPGLSAEAVASLSQQLGAMSSELATVLAWHDGQSTEFAGTFADGWCLLSGEEMRTLATHLDADPPAGWVEGWVPLARDASDSFLLLDVGTPGYPVLALWSGTERAEQLAPSLTAWFRQLLADFEAGRYVEDPERGTFINTGRERARTQTEEAEE